MKHLIYLCGSLLLAASLTGCAKTRDLDAPCPDFGRYCPQSQINTPIF